MTKTKSKSKTSKTNRKPDATTPKPQAKKGKTTPKKQSAKAKEEPAAEPAPQTETASAESLATSATTTVTETPVPTVDAETGETAAPPAVAVEEGPRTTTEGAATSDSRMPAIGTVLQKHDRQGTLRCECEVVEGGVRYGGTVYRSLSSAAIAAAKDLGLAAKAMNGWTFWGLSKTTRPNAEPLKALQRAWDRYQVTLEGFLEKAKAGEHREPVVAELQRHARVLQNLHAEVS